MFTFYLRIDVIGAVAGPGAQQLSEKSEPSVKIAYLEGNRARPAAPPSPSPWPVRNRKATSEQTP
jgi:hypothetical protein